MPYLNETGLEEWVGKAKERLAADVSAHDSGTAHADITGRISTLAEANAQDAASLKETKARLKVAESRLENLKAASKGVLYREETDSEEAYQKAVPEGAMPWAAVTSVGGESRVWNQLINGYRWTYPDISTAGGVTLTRLEGNRVRLVISEVLSDYINIIFDNFSYIKGHKYASIFDSGLDALMALSESLYVMVKVESNVSGATRASRISSISESCTSAVFLHIDGTVPVGTYEFSLGIHDLTLLYGAGGEPTTVAQFREEYPELYYGYNPGTIVSADVADISCRGRNVFAEENAEWYKGKNQSYMVCDLNIGEDKTYFIHFSDKDASVNVSGIYLGFVNNADKLESVDQYRWCLSNGSIQANKSNTSANNNSIHLNQVFIYPREKFKNIFNRYNICIDTVQNDLKYVPFKEEHIYIPQSFLAAFEGGNPRLKGYGWSAGTAKNYWYVEDGKRWWRQEVSTIDMGTVGWTVESSGRTRTTARVPGMHVVASSEDGYLDRLKNVVCSKYIAKHLLATASMEDKTVMSYGGHIYLYDSAYTDAATFKAAMSGVLLYYELADPILTDITSLWPVEDSFLPVEEGGSITFKNSHGDGFRIPVPSSVTYDIKTTSSTGDE